MVSSAVATGLTDAHGRTARDVRVSLTDRCSLRCTYCLPAHGMAWIPAHDVLGDEEVIRLLRVAVERLGVTRIRFTGGEPLLRPGLERIVGAAARLRTPGGGPPELTLTTNGLGLSDRARALRAAGLERVNVSLDSLDRQRYARLTRRDRLPRVLDGIAAAKAAGLTPVKVNSVVMRDRNFADIVPLAEFCLTHGHELRFIEQMPLGPPHEWDRAAMVTQAEILDVLARRFALTPHVGERGSATAALWDVAPDEDQPGGRIGIIGSVTAPFCASCDRTRLTADGHVRSCLFADVETDLRTPLRAGAPDEALAERWRAGHAGKPPGHGIGRPGFRQPARIMSAIGG